MSHDTELVMTQAGCRLLTLHDMPILRLHFTCVFRVSHGSRTCGMLRTAGSEVLGKDLSFVQVRTAHRTSGFSWEAYCWPCMEVSDSGTCKGFA